MVFVLNDLNPLGGQSRPSKTTPPGGSQPTGGSALWSYSSTTDNLAAVKATGYFNEARGLLAPGDVIIFRDVGSAVDIITIDAVPAEGSDVTVETADINSA